MKTIEIEIALMKHFDIRRNLIVPGVTDMSFLVDFETDLLVLSNSGYATAVEIKVSRADLKNDLKKKHIKHLESNDAFMWKSYFDMYFKNLKYFYYAVPEELKEVALNQIPSFAGLLIVKDIHYKHVDETRRVVDVIRNPKELFKKKWSEKEKFKLARLGTMRIFNLKQNLNQN